MPILRSTLVLLATFASYTVFADPLDDVLAAQADRIKATINADIDQLEKIYADDLVYAHSDGRVDDRSVLLKGISSGFVNYQKIDVVEQNVRVYDGVAVITGSAAFYVLAGEVVNDLTLRFTSVYVEKDGQWQITSWHSSRVES